MFCIKAEVTKNFEELLNSVCAIYTRLRERYLAIVIDRILVFETLSSFLQVMVIFVKFAEVV